MDSTATCGRGLRLRRKLQWDPEQELFVNDDQAKETLRHPYRDPWQI